MTVSTDGQICYGILLGDDMELPWDDFDDTINDWWIEVVHAYKPSFEVYDDKGEHLPGVGKEQIDAYWNERSAFKEAHPLPFQVVNACSGDYPTWILAVDFTCLSANRGYPQSFDPATLVVTDGMRTMLLDFCKTHGIEIGNEQPKWWLSSYWG